MTRGDLDARGDFEGRPARRSSARTRRLPESELCTTLENGPVYGLFVASRLLDCVPDCVGLRAKRGTNRNGARSRQSAESSGGRTQNATANQILGDGCRNGGSDRIADHRGRAVLPVELRSVNNRDNRTVDHVRAVHIRAVDIEFEPVQLERPELSHVSSRQSQASARLDLLIPGER